MSSQADSYEVDPRWLAVDEYGFSHLYPSSKPLNRALEAALKNQHDSGLPNIAVSPFQGSFLSLQCKFTGAKRVLEVGTLGGYSTIWLASSNPDIRVTTIDYNPKHTDVARENLTNAGLVDKVEFLVGNGVEQVQKLQAEVKSGQREPFDFFFIDADKPSNPKYLELATEMASRGACIIVDNVIRKGNVARADLVDTDANVRGSRQVIEAAGRDARLSTTLLQTVGEKNYDGMLICRLN